MARTLRPVRGALAAAALCVVVAGCGNDPQPKIADASPSSSPTTASSSAAVHPAPKPWEKKSKAGAVAFAKHWVDEFNTATTSGNVRRLTDLSAPTCKTCVNFVQLIAGVYGRGGGIDSSGWKVTGASTPPTVSNPTVALTINQSPQTVRTSSSATPKQYPGGSITYSAGLEWHNGAWRMADLGVLN